MTEMRWHLLAVLVLTLVSIGIRTKMTLAHLAFMHPDESYQSTEVAHSMYYKSGKLPNEFKSPDHPPGYLQGVDNKIYGPITSIFAARSPIYPSYFYLVMGLCETLGLDYHDSCVPLQRVAHTAVSGLLPLATFAFVLGFLNHPTAGVVAAAAVTVDNFFVWVGSHHVINGFVGPIVMACLASLSFFLPQSVSVHSADKHRVSPAVRSLALFWTFFFSAVTTYVRPDCVLTYASFTLICMPITFFSALIGPHSISIFAGGLSGLFVGGLADKLFFGVWFVSARNWVSYNVIEQLSILSGREPYFFYLDAFLVFNPAAIILLTLGCVGVWFARRHHWDDPSPLSTKRLLALAATVLALTLLFSNHPHKEERFFFLPYCLALVFGAGGTVRLVDVFITKYEPDEGEIEEEVVPVSASRVSPAAAAPPTFEFVFIKSNPIPGELTAISDPVYRGSHRDFATQAKLCCADAPATKKSHKGKKETKASSGPTTAFSHKPNSTKARAAVRRNKIGYLDLWAFLAILSFAAALLFSADNYRRGAARPWDEFEDVNQAMMFIGRQSKNVSGVAVAFPWFSVGFYSLLHTNVPTVCLESGFHEPVLPFLHTQLAADTYSHVVVHQKTFPTVDAKSFFAEHPGEYQLQFQFGKASVYGRSLSPSPTQKKQKSGKGGKVLTQSEVLKKYAQDELETAMGCMFALNGKCAEGGFVRLLQMQTSPQLKAETQVGYAWLKLQYGEEKEAAALYNEAAPHLDIDKYMLWCHKSYHTGRMGRAWFYCSTVLLSGDGELVHNAAYMIGIIIWQAGGDNAQTQQWVKMQVNIAVNCSTIFPKLSSRAMSMVGIMGNTQGFLEEASQHFSDVVKMDDTNMFGVIRFLTSRISVSHRNGEEATYSAANEAVQSVIQILGTPTHQKQVELHEYHLRLLLSYALMLTGDLDAAREEYVLVKKLRQTAPWNMRMMTTQEWHQHGGVNATTYLVPATELPEEYFTLGYDLAQKKKQKGKTPRVLIVTLFDNNNKAIGEMWERSWRPYAQRHGYDLKVEKSTLDSSRPTAWSKILLLLRELPNYDWVLWADTDSLVWRPELTLDRFIEDTDHDVFVEIDMHMIMNTGLILARSCEFSIFYFKTVWAQTDQINADFWENSAMVKMWHAAPTFRDRVAILPYASLHTYPPHRTGRDFILHFPGTDHKENKMKKTLSFLPTDETLFPPPPKKNFHYHSTPSQVQDEPPKKRESKNTQRKPVVEKISKRPSSPPSPSSDRNLKEKQEASESPPPLTMNASPPPLIPRGGEKLTEKPAEKHTDFSSEKKAKPVKLEKERDEEEEEEDEEDPPRRSTTRVDRNPADRNPAENQILKDAIEYGYETFTVVVPTHNDEDVIANTIQSLVDPFSAALRDPAIKSGELVVVMDGCVDNTEDQARLALLSFPFPHKLISTGLRALGAGAARNHGAKAADGKILFFVDSDDIVFENHFVLCMEMLRENPTVAYTKTNIKFRDYIHPYWVGAIQSSLVLNLAVKKEAFEFLEGFVEMPGAGGEDSALNTDLSLFFQGRRIETETVEYVRKPGGLFEKQLKKFQHGPEYEQQLSQEIGDEYNPAYASMLQNRARWLKVKLFDVKLAPHAIALFIPAIQHYSKERENR